MDVRIVLVTIFIASLASISTLATIFDVMQYGTTFDVTQYGAIGDGITDDTNAFLQAWNAFCSSEDENPVLNVPEDKTFLLAPLNFQGPCKSSAVQVQILGNIVAPPSGDAWTACVRQTWIVFSVVDGLTVSGSGQIDGQGSSWWVKGDDYAPKACGRPSALRFSNCNNMVLSGLTHINPPNHHIVIDHSNNVEISNLNINAPGDSPNTDGIDIASSTQVSIHDLNIQTGDDCIAVSNGTSYINITSVTCGPGHGISIGSLGQNGDYAQVEQIYVKNCTFNQSKNGCRIKTWPGGEGYVKYVTFEQITLNDVKNPIFIDQHYCFDSHGVEHYCPDKGSAVQIQEVTYKDIEGSSMSKIAIKLDCNSVNNCTNIAMANVNITGDGVTSSCNNANGTAYETFPSVDCLSSTY